jgi:hypothetical protein
MRNIVENNSKEPGITPYSDQVNYLTQRWEEHTEE